MSREVQIVKWCDCCEAEAETVDGQEPLPIKTPAVTTFVVGIAEGEDRKPSPKLVDVCDVHAKRITEILNLTGAAPQAVDLKPALAASALPPRTLPPAPSSRQVNCPVCKVLTNRGSLVTHVWNKHRTDVRPDLPTSCPECGSKEYESGQGLAAHRRAAHAYSALVEALVGVKGYKVTGREADL